jgi:phage-related protein
LNKASLNEKEQHRKLASIEWEGDSRQVLVNFPKEITRKLGAALYALQQGERPTVPTRSMASIGPGVFELKAADERAWYRMIYLARISDRIHVLHCFEKSSRKTDARDLRLAKQRRLAQVRKRLEGKNHED